MNPQTLSQKRRGAGLQTSQTFTLERRIARGKCMTGEQGKTLQTLHAALGSGSGKGRFSLWSLAHPRFLTVDSQQ